MASEDEPDDDGSDVEEEAEKVVDVVRTDVSEKAL